MPSPLEPSSLVLAFDTSESWCSTSLIRGEECLCHLSEERQHGHAGVLVGQIERTLKQAQCSYQDLQALSVGVGPGSFTGIRVTLATALGLEKALKIPVYGYTVFTVLHQMLLSEGVGNTPLLLAVDSKKETPFIQPFDQGKALRPPYQPSKDALEGLLQSQDWSIFGSGAEGLALKFNQKKPLRPFTHLDIQILGKLPYTGVASSPLQPLYLRSADALVPKNMSLWAKA